MDTLFEGEELEVQVAFQHHRCMGGIQSLCGRCCSHQQNKLILWMLY